MRRCIKCKTPTGIFIPHHKLSLCKEHYVEWYQQRVETTIRKFRMFTRDDRILVAVSGGKDSLALWHALVSLGYEADGFIIDLGFGQFSEDSIHVSQKLASSLGRPLHVMDLNKEFYSINEIKKKDRRPICSICGTVKRYLINLYAKKLGYQVVATGHNLDDEVAVLLVNTLSWNVEYLRRQYPVLKEGNGFVRKIKPLCKTTEMENRTYVEVNEIEFVEYKCPYSKGATSIEYKKFIEDLENTSPGTKLRFYSEFLRKVYPLLQKGVEDQGVKPCKVCGEPTSGEVCAVCLIKQKMSG